MTVKQNWPFSQHGWNFWLKYSYERYTNKGHLIASLYNSNNDTWIECNDTDVSEGEKPTRGLLFIYDRLDENENSLDSSKTSEAQHSGQSTEKAHCKREKSSDRHLGV